MAKAKRAFSYLKSAKSNGGHRIARQATSINRAFALAVAPTDVYTEKEATNALRALGQLLAGPWKCVYGCGREAANWDHLTSLVKNQLPRGPGNQYGNLVPACKRCDEIKDSRSYLDWQDFVRRNPDSQLDGSQKEALITLLTSYTASCGRMTTIEDLDRLAPQEWAAYSQIRLDIHQKLKEADELVAILRAKLGA